MTVSPPPDSGRWTYAVPVGDRWLIHAPLHKMSALVNDAAKRELARRLGSASGAVVRGDEASPASMRALLEALSAEGADRPRPREGELSPLFLGLLPTLSCNLDCAYCDFGADGASGEHMDPALACAAVDWMAERVRGRGGDVLDVHFFGGEPFQACEVVEVAVHRARNVAARNGLLPCFQVATNGVFSEELCRFVGDYFDTVVLSFDGPPEVQNRQRAARHGAATYTVVERTARMLSQAPAELAIRICVTQANVAELESIATWMCREFQPRFIDFETLKGSQKTVQHGLYPPDPRLFAVHWTKAARAVTRLGATPVYAAVASEEEPRLTFCPVGRDAVIVTPDGRVMACYLPEDNWKERGLDLELGRFDPNAGLALAPGALERIRRVPERKPRCDRCFARWTCAGGCHVSNTWPGCSLEYDDFCIQTRLILAVQLLQGMGADDLAEEVLAGKKAMDALVGHPSDRLGDQ